MSITGNLKMPEIPVIEQAPPDGASPASGEATPTAETTGSEAPKESKNDAFVSGSSKARKLGESRKKLAEVLLQNAKDSQEIREQVKSLCQKEPELDKYLSKYFKKDYEVIFKDKLVEEVEAEELETKEKAKAVARAELLVEQLREEKQEMIYDFAHKLSFTSSEAAALKDMVLRLEGQQIGDEELNFDEALKRAAHIIRPDKTRAVLTSIPSGMTAETTPSVQNAEKNERIALVAKKLGAGKTQEVMKNLEFVDKHYDAKRGVFQIPLD